MVINPRPREDAPVRKLTTGLLKTYKSINERYYEAKKARAAAKAGAPKAEDYVVQVGDMLGTHYKVEESMGKGSFGQVVAATDTRTGVRVAVKVIKNKDAFRRQARTEIKLLELLNRKDLSDECCIGAFATPAQRPSKSKRRLVARIRFRTLTCVSLSLAVATATEGTVLTHSRSSSRPPCPLLQCASLSLLTTTATRALCSSTFHSTCTSCCERRSSEACRSRSSASSRGRSCGRWRSWRSPKLTSSTATSSQRIFCSGTT